jgi:hypothetical protein
MCLSNRPGLQGGSIRGGQHQLKNMRNNVRYAVSPNMHYLLPICTTSYQYALYFTNMHYILPICTISYRSIDGSNQDLFVVAARTVTLFSGDALLLLLPIPCKPQKESCQTEKVRRREGLR